MNRTLVFVAAMAAAAVVSSPAIAQAPAAAAAPAAVAPQAVPAKIAIIAFEQVVFATNEGQKTVADIQKKYEPKKAAIDQLASQVEALQKQLQALPANTPDGDRAKLERDIDAKQKQLQLDGNSAQEAYQADLQEAFGKIAQKVGASAVKYAQDNGFTLVVNSGGQQQSPFLWWQPQTDISQAVINAYNASTPGIAAPAPSAPAAQHHSVAPARPTHPATK